MQSSRGLSNARVPKRVAVKVGGLQFLSIMFYQSLSTETTQRPRVSHVLRFPRPETAPPSLPNCLPRPDRGFDAGGIVAWPVSFTGTGGPVCGRVAWPLRSKPSPSRSSPTPRLGPSFTSPASLWARRARSCTVRNFSSSSVHRMMPSSRPFNRLGRSKFEPAGVVVPLRGKL